MVVGSGCSGSSVHDGGLEPVVVGADGMGSPQYSYLGSQPGGVTPVPVGTGGFDDGHSPQYSTSGLQSGGGTPVVVGDAVVGCPQYSYLGLQPVGMAVELTPVPVG